MTPSPADTLQIIQNRLDRSIPIAQIIEELLPFTLNDAKAWARRLAFWDEMRRECSGQAIALARVVSKRTMCEFALAFDRDGRVVEEKEIRPRPSKEIPDKIFTMRIGDDTVEVRYTQHYQPVFREDHFYFLGEELSPPPDPNTGCFLYRKPNALSNTGYWSHFASHDAVEAAGGPEQYVALLAEAKQRGKDKDFELVFTGERPVAHGERKRPIRRRSANQVVGEHTAAVAEEREPETQQQKPPQQKELFS